METKELKELIIRKENEIKQLLELQDLLPDKHLKEQIDLRLDDLSKLYKQIKNKD